jgi:hypothetical protein
MCISLTHTQELKASTVITNSFGNIHNITYLMELNGNVGDTGGFIIFPGPNVELIESPTINSILNYKEDLINQHTNGRKFNNYRLDATKNKYIDSQTQLYNNLASFRETIDNTQGNSEKLEKLVDQLSTKITQDQSFILCLFPLNRGAVALTYRLEGELVIPGWENDHDNIDIVHPVVERQTTFIIGKTSNDQTIKYNQYVPSTNSYCFPTSIINYSEGLEESLNGNLALATNQYGWHHLQVAA